LCGNRGLIGLLPFYNDDDDDKVSVAPFDTASWHDAKVKITVKTVKTLKSVHCINIYILVIYSQSFFKKT